MAWLPTNGKVLNQGDLLRGIAVPIVQSSFPEQDNEGAVPLQIGQANIVIMSQSCDLEQAKVPNVVVARTFSLDEFEAVNPSYRTRGRWNEVARGRVEALHLLPPINSVDPRTWILVDFREIYALPFGYVERFASMAGDRWRLQPPYLECLSQAFGKFFMRVALPTDPPDFSKTVKNRPLCTRTLRSLSFPPLLKEGAKRNILGGSAARLFGLDPKPVKKIP